MDVSILIPAYNEAESIVQTVQRLLSCMGSQERSFEILICDDGSRDDTANVIAALGDPRVYFVGGAHTGKGGALARGVARAEGKWIFYTDADLAYGTDVIEQFLSALEQGRGELVLGSRLLHKQGYAGYSFPRRVFSKAYQGALRLLGGIDAGDPQCGCKAYTARSAKEMFADLSELGFAFEQETLLKAKRAGYSVCELPVRIISNGESHVRPLRDGLSMLRAARRTRRKYK